MVRYLAAVLLLLLLQDVSSTAPVPCAACDRGKASLIGKVTCNAQGNLVAECPSGLIHMKVDGKFYDFDRVTCIGGDWFGTSCAGIAVYLASGPEESTCPDVENPEVPLEGTQCTIRPIGIDSIYDEYFSALPQPYGGAPGGFVCEDQPQWQKFRKGTQVGVFGGFYVRDDSEPIGYKAIGDHYSHSILECVLNPASGKLELSLDKVFIGTNQIECLYDKCPEFQKFNADKGRCEANGQEVCGYAISGPIGDWSFLSLPIPTSDANRNTSLIGSDITHIAVLPGFKVTVLGTRMHSNPDDGPFPLLYSQYNGLWAIYNALEMDLYWFEGINKPTAAICYDDGAITNTPTLNGQGPYPFVVSHESRYATFSIGADALFELKYMENEFSMSFTGTGKGRHVNICIIIINILSLTFSGSGYERHIDLDFQNKQISCDRDGGIVQTSSIFIDSEEFHVRFRYWTDYLFIYVNGRLVWRPWLQNFYKVKTIRVQQDGVAIDGGCKIFVPKRCDSGHFFSEKSGDCEYSAFLAYSGSREEFADKCALLSQAPTSASAWVRDDLMPDGYEFNTSFIQVRQGCIAYAYNGEDEDPAYLRGNYRLEHWKERYAFPSYQDGTAKTLERGLKHLECFCDDYMKLPTVAESKADFMTIDVDGGFVFSASNQGASPMVPVTFTNSDGDAPLIIYFGSGKLVVDNLQGGCGENYLMESSKPIVAGVFESRIHYGDAGYEIWINGYLTMTYPYRLANRVIKKAKIPKALVPGHYRSFSPPPTPGSVDFASQPLKLGDFLHFNGVPLNGGFNISLLDASQKPLYTLEWRKSERKIVQSLLKKGTKHSIESRTVSLTIGVEFDIVLANKAHAIEVYINGELIDVLKYHVIHPEKEFRYAQLNGEVKIFEQRRGPKKIEGMPKWKNNSG